MKVSQVASCGLAAALIVTTGAGASAQDAYARAFAAKDACWQRTYNAAHLAAHPKQRARTIVVAFRPHTFVDGKRIASRAERFELGVGVSVTGDPELYTTSAYCRAFGNAIQCELEADGGQLRISLEAGGALRISTNAIRIEGMKRSIEIGAKSDDRMFLVPRASGASCDRVRRAI